jgi:hypothetical protein
VLPCCLQQIENPDNQNPRRTLGIQDSFCP